MAGKVFTLWGSIRADDTLLKKDLVSAHQQVGKAASKMRASVDTAAKKMGKALGVAMAVGAGIAVYEMVKVGKAAIKAASDLEETTGKFNVVFKGQEEVARGWSKTLVESYAMSTEESKRFLSSIQDLLVPMGMGAVEAGKMSFEVTKLAADLGSFNNLPTAQVMLDIQSALVGNFETMKKYGVILNETVVKAKALEMGLWDGKGALDANIKAQVAYKLMLEGSAAAIGDQARTMDSYANQLKSLKATWEDLLAAIGNKILPMATAVVSMMNEWIKANQNLISQNVGDVTGRWAEGFKSVLEAMQGVVTAIGIMSAAWDGVVAVGQIAIHGFVVAVEGLFESFRLLLRPVEGLYYALERFGIMSWNPVTDALNAIDKALYDVKMSTEDAMNTAISKVNETTKSYDGYDEAIQTVIDSVGKQKEVTEQLGEIGNSIISEMGNTWEGANEPIKETSRTIEKIIGYINDIPVTAKVRVDAEGNAIANTAKVIGNLETITGGKAKKGGGSGSVSPVGGIGTDLTASSTIMAGSGHKAKIDVIGDAKEKTKEIKGKIDEIKEPVDVLLNVTGDATAKTEVIKDKIDEIKKPVDIPIMVEGEDGIKTLTTVSKYHDDLDGRRTDSYHTVHVNYESSGSGQGAGTKSLGAGTAEATASVAKLSSTISSGSGGGGSHVYPVSFVGSGSTTKPLGEKVEEVLGWIGDVQNKAKEGATYLVDFTGSGSEIKPLKAKVNDVIGWIKDVGNFLSKKYDFDVDFSSITEMIGQMVQLLSVMNNTADAATDVYRSITRISASGFVTWDDYNKYGRLINRTGSFQTGGQIPGYGGGDTVPAMLEKGEYVINKDAVKRYGGGFFDSLNGMVAKFADGGSTDPRRFMYGDGYDAKFYKYQDPKAYTELQGFLDSLTQFSDKTKLLTPAMKALSETVYSFQGKLKAGEDISIDFIRKSAGALNDTMKGVADSLQSRLSEVVSNIAKYSSAAFVSATVDFTELTRSLKRSVMTEDEKRKDTISGINDIMRDIADFKVSKQWDEAISLYKEAALEQQKLFESATTEGERKQTLDKITEYTQEVERIEQNRLLALEHEQKVLETVIPKFTSVLDDFQITMEPFLTAIEDMTRDLYRTFGELVNRNIIPEGKSSGGYISGYGGGDTVSAMLEKGEYVINKNAVKEYGTGVFDKLNALKLVSGGPVVADRNLPSIKELYETRPGYAKGGPIPGYGVETGPQGLPNTGLFYGHKGEIVKSPRESDKERKEGDRNVTINISPGVMMGNKAEARQFAIAMKRELEETGRRYG